MKLNFKSIVSLCAVCFTWSLSLCSMEKTLSRTKSFRDIVNTGPMVDVLKELRFVVAGTCKSKKHKVFKSVAKKFDVFCRGKETQGIDSVFNDALKSLDIDYLVLEVLYVFSLDKKYLNISVFCHEYLFKKAREQIVVLDILRELCFVDTIFPSKKDSDAIQVVVEKLNKICNAQNAYAMSNAFNRAIDVLDLKRSVVEMLRNVSWWGKIKSTPENDVFTDKKYKWTWLFSDIYLSKKIKKRACCLIS